MKVETKKLDRGQTELTIELSIEEYLPFLKVAATKISENTKIPGFRPGKADFEIIKQKIGEGQIWQEALEPAVQKTFTKALDDSKLVTVGSPKIDVIKLAPNNPVIYKATVSLLPGVELGDYTSIKIAKKEITVTDEQIDKIISDLQKNNAKEILEDKKIATGDKVDIDFEIFIDKVPIDHGKQSGFSLVIGEKTFIPGFEEQLIGLDKDAEKKFKLKFPDKYHQKNLAGREADFKVKINAVYLRELPELNDDFAKIFGEFKTFQELKDKIKKNLKTENESKENKQIEEQMLDQIIAASKFEDIPDILVNSETKKMIEELEYSLKNQGLKFEDYLNHLNKKREDLLIEFTPQAVKRVKSALVMRLVGEKNDIKVSDEEIEKEIIKALAQHPGNQELEKNVKEKGYHNYIKNIIASRKVLEHLKKVMVS